MIGTIMLAMVGALIGGMVGLAWCKPEDRARAGRKVALLANILVGGLVGLGVCAIGLSSQLRYQTEIHFVADGQTRIEPPRDPNGYLRVWLFGHQVHEEVGPREEMIVWHRRLNWFILIAFITAGASLGLLLGLIPRRRTSPSG
jgi:hypothetical protein